MSWLKKRSRSHNPQKVLNKRIFSPQEVFDALIWYHKINNGVINWNRIKVEVTDSHFVVIVEEKE